MNVKELLSPDKQIECIILLNGNFIPVRIFKNKANEFNELLLNTTTSKSTSPFVSLLGAMIKVDTIVGWYFREIVQSPTDKVIDFMEKKLPDNNEGEEWKS